MAKGASASASSSAGPARASSRGVPVAPRAQNMGGQKRNFKKAPKSKQPDLDDDELKRVLAREQKKSSVRASMMLEGKSEVEIDAEMRKIDEEFKRKPKPPKPEEPPEMDMGGGDSGEQPQEQEEQPRQKDEAKPKAMLLPRKKGLPSKFGAMAERGLKVAPLAPDSKRVQQRTFKRQPSILAMTLARTPLKAANTSKAPSLGARGGFAATGGKGGFSGGPSGGAGGPR